MDYQAHILKECMESSAANPLEIVQKILQHPEFPIAGQAHHPLIAGSLISAYANAAKADNQEKLVEEGMRRANTIPGGFCAGFGADAAAIALGISVSVILTNNVKAESAGGRAKAHTLTGMGMLTVANNSGNRCCRRSTYSMLVLGANYFKNNLGIELDVVSEADVKCPLKTKNSLCNGEACKYY